MLSLKPSKLYSRAIFACLFLGVSAIVSAMPEPGDKVPDHYIVVLKSGYGEGSARSVAQEHGLSPNHYYAHVYGGFSAKVPEARLSALRNDARVEAIFPDTYVAIDRVGTDKKCATPPCGGGGGDTTSPPPATNPQDVPTGIRRIDAPASSTLSGNGAGSVDVDVAVIDTGIYKHPDLNVVGGINCSSGPSGKYNDGNGHGTHVSGTIGAKDNDFGVVGVAPGARLWAVRVLNNAGSGFMSDVICGIDWVKNNAAVIDVANMSLGGSGNDSGGCAGSAEHQAICNAVAAGVTFVVAAGNESDDAANHTPAAFDEVITVSALADFDGEPGGNGVPTCRTDVDDTFANFSNYGADVDIIAPGVCIKSTWNDGGYNTISGTSMATPHVTGAAALYLSENPGADPALVKAKLRMELDEDKDVPVNDWNWSVSEDKDGIKEPLLNMRGF